MQVAIHALMLASVAAAVLLGNSLTGSADSAPVPAELPEAVPATVATPTAAYATVAKPFGASVRAAPSWEAAGLSNAACGIILPVASVEGGWVKVQTEGKLGWVAASRVALGAGPIGMACGDRPFLHASTEASTHSDTGCLVLRGRPSADAAELACVGDGHVYAVVDGPFDPGTGRDWFRVSSPGTGTGWVPADHLHPR
jgi:hypothetical protein